MMNTKIPELRNLRHNDWTDIVSSIGYKSVNNIQRIVKPFVVPNVPNQEIELTCTKENNEEIVLKFNMYGLCNFKLADSKLYPQADSAIEMYEEESCRKLNKEFIAKMLNLAQNSASKLEYCGFLQLFLNNAIPTHQKEFNHYNGLIKQIQIDEKHGHEVRDEFVEEVISRLKQHKKIYNGLSRVCEYVDDKIREINSSSESSK